MRGSVFFVSLLHFSSMLSILVLFFLFLLALILGAIIFLILSWVSVFVFIVIFWAVFPLFFALIDLLLVLFHHNFNRLVSFGLTKNSLIDYDFFHDYLLFLSYRSLILSQYLMLSNLNRFKILFIIIFTSIVPFFFFVHFLTVFFIFNLFFDTGVLLFLHNDLLLYILFVYFNLRLLLGSLVNNDNFPVYSSLGLGWSHILGLYVRELILLFSHDDVVGTSTSNNLLSSQFVSFKVLLFLNFIFRILIPGCSIFCICLSFKFLNF